MLSRVVELIENENFTINNIDITLLVEKPKIAPYREQIVRSLQTILKLDLNRISLKAKTNEKMGFVGREEGVVAYVVVTLIKNEREHIPAPAPMQNFIKNRTLPLISFKILLIELISLS